ncbi:MAG: fluoride efflux transporter CrcB [Gemmatimonadetes bacterium]|nr:MAG: fluoride efflux transporter CrcB [Gemmatimonadota bacterium]
MEFALNRPLSGLMTPTETIHGRSFSLTILYIALAGAAGTLTRFGTERLVSGRLATLLVNLVGSLILGFVVHYATRSGSIAPAVRSALTIGFCGGLTTMSTFSYESLALLVQGQYPRAALYMGATIIGCLGAVLGGMVLAERLV